MITSIAATTGTTKFKLDRMMRIVSSAVISGILRGGAMVPETTNQVNIFSSFFLLSTFRELYKFLRKKIQRDFMHGIINRSIVDRSSNLWKFNLNPIKHTMFSICV